MSEIHETTPLIVTAVEKDPPFTSSRNDNDEHDDTEAAVVVQTTITSGTMMSPFEYGGDEMSNYSSYRLYQASQNTRDLIFVVIGCAILYFIVGFGARNMLSFPSFGTTPTTFA